MIKKVKDSNRKPPLSTLDKTLYGIVFCIGIGLGIYIWILLGIQIPEEIGFSGEGVIACKNYWALFVAAPLAICAGSALVLLAAKGLDQRQPIFGNKKVENPHLYPIAVYPLVSGEFWEKLTDKTKEDIRWWAKNSLVLFVLCLAVLLIGFYPRSVLYEDGRIERYGITINWKIPSILIRQIR